ncbi:hydrogenase-3 nickel incorporation protein HypA [Roseiarcus fermentans]|uniref:Hydrogenase maturation factor HypA n=1 Tax=Roseiarcus fermentans TaxID=1473586 RepID=A0A366F9B2_9HYPH|nr:hydrogenase maturation nickel metallochaperone HypA [Roseiarcus fermentans]RBP11231.1 hydrogenase-3 nickel incorporation protein HypA [Roseiarcus fermentans]
MHEMALTESIVEIAVETARREGAARVRRVFVDVGALSHAEPEALLFCFDAVSAGTIAAGATLDIARIPGAGWCMDCGKTVPLAERFGACPECGRSHVQMTAGDAMRVREIEVD